LLLLSIIQTIKAVRLLPLLLLLLLLLLLTLEVCSCVVFPISLQPVLSSTTSLPIRLTAQRTCSRS
jgi:hypothetical protein